MLAEKHGFLRLCRVLISVTVCLYAAAMISSMLWFDYDGHYTHRAAAPQFAMMFLFPITATIIVVMTGVLFSIDRLQAKPLRLAAIGDPAKRNQLIWPAACLLGVFSGYVWPIVGVPFVFLLLYWVLTGRLGGGRGWSVRNFSATRWDEKLSLLVVGYLLISWTTTIVFGAWLAALPVALGTPEYAVEHDNRMTSSVKAALHRFPDPQSCLVDGAIQANRDDLLRMNWDRIDTTSEAEVCIFRLLHEWGGGVRAAPEWLRSQGFNVRADKLFEDRNGTLRVDGSWSIKNNGPRFPTTGPVRRILRAMPYGMSVYVTYTPDGARLMHLHISYSTL